MPFIYDELAKKDDKPRKFDRDKFDATAYWAYHYKNWVYLDRLSKRSSFQNKMQAEKEMLIAERKMKFWERQAGFDMDLARKLIKS